MARVWSRALLTPSTLKRAARADPVHLHDESVRQSSTRKHTLRSNVRAFQASCIAWPTWRNLGACGHRCSSLVSVRFSSSEPERSKIASPRVPSQLGSTHLAPHNAELVWHCAPHPTRRCPPPPQSSVRHPPLSCCVHQLALQLRRDQRRFAARAHQLTMVGDEVGSLAATVAPCSSSPPAAATPFTFTSANNTAANNNSTNLVENLAIFVFFGLFFSLAASAGGIAPKSKSRET